MRCSVCGHKNDDAARFCSQCGNPLGVTCPTCGIRNEAGSRFCTSCGTNLGRVGPGDHRDDIARYVPVELLLKIGGARAGGTMRGERRTVTMLFADIQGSTAAAEHLDPEDWAEIMNGAFEHLIAPVYRYEGTLAHLQGDAILAFFGAPIAHEDDPERAVRAALAIRDWAAESGDVQVRIAVTTGEALVRRLASVLPADIRVTGAMLAPDGFDARFSAIWRRYVYRVTDTPFGSDPLRRNHVLAHHRPLDLDAMNAASAGLLGEHDFAAFCRRREGATTVRTLRRLDWERESDGTARAVVEADAFCHNQVRALVGALLLVGDGRRTVDWPTTVLVGRVRDSGVTVAPPHGLTLEAVGYPPAAELAEHGGGGLSEEAVELAEQVADVAEIPSRVQGRAVTPNKCHTETSLASFVD
jgi:tRNA pseudouridine(38-40) synthase